MERSWSNIAGFEDGEMEPQEKECEQILQGGKGRETNSLLEPTKGMQPCTPGF